jgi:hypothetical protein
MRQCERVCMTAALFALTDCGLRPCAPAGRGAAAEPGWCSEGPARGRHALQHAVKPASACRVALLERFLASK